MEERQILLDPNQLMELGIDLKQLAKGLMSGLGSSQTGNWMGVIDSLFKFGKSLRLKKGPEYLAWQLIHRSLLGTFASLCDTSDAGNQGTDRQELYIFNNHIVDLIEKGKFRVDAHSFCRPGTLPFLDEVISSFKEYIEKAGSYYDDTPEQAIAKFKLHFVHQLNAEQYKHKEEYQPLVDYFNPLLAGAESREVEWYNYRNYVKSLFDGQLFGSKVRLSDVYICLRGAIHKLRDKKTDYYNQNNEPAFDQEIVTVDNYLLDWVNNPQDDEIKIISGGPGYGKSTILKHIALELASDQRNVFFFSLYDLDIDGDIDRAIDRYFNETQFFKSNPIDYAQKNILIFDGLDELIMQGEFSLKKVEDFLLKIMHKIRRVNQIERKLLVIVSGRKIIVDKCDSIFEHEGKLNKIELYPYYIPSNRSRFLYDQRVEWWEKYAATTGKEIPDYIYDEKLEDLTSFPLLNCLLALAIEDGFSYSPDVNMNVVYEALISSVYKKRYPGVERSGARCPISIDLFFDTLSEIAYCAWKNNGRTIDVSSVEQHLRDVKKLPEFESFKSDVAKKLNCIFVLFYFQQPKSTVKQSPTFEFTHKSFTEYLTAIRLCKSFWELAGLYLNSSADKPMLIRELKELLYLSEEDKAIREFLLNEVIKKDADIAMVSRFTQSFIEGSLKKKPQKGYENVNLHDLKYESLEDFVFTLYYRLYDQAAYSKICVPEKYSLKNFFLRRCGNMAIRYMQFRDQACSCVNLERYIFHSVDFMEITFKLTQMDRVSFSNSCFSNVAFLKSELNSLSITDSIFRYGKFENTDIYDLEMKHCRLENVVFTRTNFSCSKIVDSEIDGCTLPPCQFESCQFINMDFTHSEIFNSYLILRNKFRDCKISVEQHYYIEGLPRDREELKTLGFYLETYH